MGKGSNKPKKRKLKTVVTSITTPAGTTSGSSTPAGFTGSIRNAAVQAVSSLKRTIDGGLKLVSNRVIQTNNPEPPVATQPRQTVEDVISAFLQQSEAHGWDQGYMESFLENPKELGDLEVVLEEQRPKRETGQGVSPPVSVVSGSSFLVSYLGPTNILGPGTPSMDARNRRLPFFFNHARRSLVRCAAMSQVRWGRSGRLSLCGLQ